MFEIMSNLGDFDKSPSPSGAVLPPRMPEILLILDALQAIEFVEAAMAATAAFEALIDGFEIQEGAHD